jgi:hypothetical protein
LYYDSIGATPLGREYDLNAATPLLARKAGYRARVKNDRDRLAGLCPVGDQA